MARIGILEEFFHRKSDGIGMSDRYPRVAGALQTIYDLIPEDIRDFSDEDIVTLMGAAAERGIKWQDLASSVINDGPVKVLAETARDRMIEKAIGEPATVAVKEVMEPGSGIPGAIMGRVAVAVGVAITLGSYELIRRANDHLHKQDDDWHRKNGIEMMKGSNLHNWAGGPARGTVEEPASPARETEQLKPLEVHRRLREFNPFIRAHPEDEPTCVDEPDRDDWPGP